MKKLDWKVRFTNKTFIVQLILAVFTPILAYAGLTAEDLTTWERVGNLLIDALSNPYVLMLVAVSVGNTINNPTTKGLGD